MAGVSNEDFQIDLLIQRIEEITERIAELHDWIERFHDEDREMWRKADSQLIALEKYRDERNKILKKKKELGKITSDHGYIEIADPAITQNETKSVEKK